MADPSERLRRALVRGLAVRSDAVRNAFLAVPRERFVPDVAAKEGLKAVYRDDAIVTKFARNGAPLSSSSAPSVMAAMLDRLELEPGMRVLEIGAGTGYNAALLAELAGPRGSVTTIDVDAGIARTARAALRAGGHRVTVVVGDGRAGHARRAPYDRIVATASTDAVPRPWFDQLREGGLLQVPLRIAGAQVIPTFRKHDGRLSTVAVVAGGFMPLRSADESGAMPPPPACLIATDLTERDRRAPPLCQVTGEALGSLAPAAKRRVLATALSDGETRTLGHGTDGLILYLTLTLPASRAIAVMPGWTVGLISRDGGSLAYVDGEHGTLTAHGDDRARNELLRAIESWSERGRPGPAQLRFTVEYEGSRPRLRRRWAR